MAEGKSALTVLLPSGRTGIETMFQLDVNATFWVKYTACPWTPISKGEPIPSWMKEMHPLTIPEALGVKSILKVSLPPCERIAEVGVTVKNALSDRMDKIVTALPEVLVIVTLSVRLAPMVTVPKPKELSEPVSALGIIFQRAKLNDGFPPAVVKEPPA